MDVLNGVGVIGVGWICVGNSDGLVVFDGVVGELNTVSPSMAAAVTVLAEPSVVTVKAVAAAVVEESGSLWREQACCRRW